jgi:hypothetical protein
MDPNRQISNNTRIDLLHNTGSTVKTSGSRPAANSAGSLTSRGVKPAAENLPKVSPMTPVGMAGANPAPKPMAPVRAARPANLSAPQPRPAPAPPPLPVGTEAPNRKRAFIVVGIILLVLAGAGAAAFVLLKPKPQPPSVAITPVLPTDLTAADDASGNDVKPAGSTAKAKLQMSIPTTANSGEIVAEVEIEPQGKAFTDTVTAASSPISASGQALKAAVAIDSLPDGAYHWQARTTVGNDHSQWVVVSTDATQPDFVIDTKAPAAPVLTKINGQPVAGSTAAVTTNRPPLAGTAEPNSSIAISIGPDSIKLNATADGQGSWSVTPTADVPNGSHTVDITAIDGAGNISAKTSLTLGVNAATAAATPAATPAPAAPAAASSPATPSTTPAASPAASPTAAAKPASSALPGTGGAATAQTTASQPTSLANTGQSTHGYNLLALALLLLSAFGLTIIRRLARG